jgi:hypothetical protein
MTFLANKSKSKLESNQFLLPFRLPFDRTYILSALTIKFSQLATSMPSAAVAGWAESNCVVTGDMVWRDSMLEYMILLIGEREVSVKGLTGDKEA